MLVEKSMWNFIALSIAICNETVLAHVHAWKNYLHESKHVGVFFSPFLAMTM
jgi:hypothetical protein